MRKWLMLVLVLMAGLPARARSATPDAPPSNPLLAEWTTPFGVPPFDRIRPEHYLPAYRAAITRHSAEVEAIAKDRHAPTFANTIEALEASGELLSRVNAVFDNITSAETNDTLQAIAREVAPLMAAHRDDVRLNEALFRRVKAVWDGRAAHPLASDQAKLLENTWKDFVRGGALLTPEQKQRFRAINADLAALTVRFGDDVLKDGNAFRLVIERREDLAGLPEAVVAGGAEAAKHAGLEGQWLYTLDAPSLWPFLQYSANRELRRRMFTAYITRADHGDSLDNKAVLGRIVTLRAERARLLGYKSHADYVLDENMAKTPDKVYDLLMRLWKPASAVAAREAADLQAAIRADGDTFALRPWDWFYYTEKVRRQRFDLDEQALRPYFPLERVREGAFEVAHRLYGVTFTPRPDLPVYHPEVKAFEVKDGDGSLLGIYYVDYHPRPGKRGGAWSNEYREPRLEHGRKVRPVVVNVCNFSRPAGDTPALLSLDESETLFHEFGHALHTLVSQVRYRSLLQVPQDFVELPSQIMENWATEPEVLALYAKHWKTGEVIPAALVEKIKASRRFNQGFASTEYLAASILDMDWHTRTSDDAPDVTAFENSSMGRIGMPSTIVPRYRSVYFRHVFAGGYSAGYYSYIWAEVLDADAFEAFKEKGLFDPTTARAFRGLLEKGGSEDAMALFTRFRGREPSVEPLLRKRGLE